MNPFFLFGRVDPRAFEVSALEEGVNGCTGNREEFRNFTHLDKRRDWFFL